MRERRVDKEKEEDKQGGEKWRRVDKVEEEKKGE